ncbi:MAG TPA: Tellurium resistance protein terZ [Chromatiaceae bacterium]|jgi:tellurium resistance protein TerZ|nr:MAG: TerD family protein [Thiohalocapsa sp. PB-PSB1]HBG95270.1 Tellurium resistance protein terZ [Chromatiaceae bacterium]HCS91732.1 Tellurium resistance protein terZ [Chromatiaceae bacterium]
MSINLTKGQRISLEKDCAPGLSQVALGLGWGQREKKGLFGGTKQVDVDLDASCLLFANRNLIDVVWFQQLRSKDGAVVHTGDDRSGGGSADNEIIRVDLTRLPKEVDALIFTVNSFLNDSFEGIPNARCRLLDAKSDQELARFDLTLDGGGHTGMVMAKLYRKDGAWNLHAIGDKGHGRTFQEMEDIITRTL